MFEKFSILDIDSSGRGGEYTVQVRTNCLYVDLYIAKGYQSTGGIWLDERCRSVDRRQLWKCPCCTQVSQFTGCAECIVDWHKERWCRVTGAIVTRSFDFSGSDNFCLDTIYVKYSSFENEIATRKFLYILALQ